MSVARRSTRAYVQTAAGSAVLATGVAGIVTAGLGADPYTVLLEGVHVASGVPLGASSVLTGCVMVVLARALGLRPGPGLIFTVGMVGLVVSLVASLISTPDVLVGRVLMMAASAVAIGAGVGTYQAAGLGAGPVDGIPAGLALRGLPLSRGFLGSQFAFLATGAVLGGTVGFGTVVAAVCVGPIAGATTRLWVETPAARGRWRERRRSGRHRPGGR